MSDLLSNRRKTRGRHGVYSVHAYGRDQPRAGDGGERRPERRSQGVRVLVPGRVNGLGSVNANLPGVRGVGCNTHEQGTGTGHFFEVVEQRVSSWRTTPRVSSRSKGDPILYINDPPGVPDNIRRRSLDSINAINKMNLDAVEIPTDADADLSTKWRSGCRAACRS